MFKPQLRKGITLKRLVAPTLVCLSFLAVPAVFVSGAVASSHRHASRVGLTTHTSSLPTPVSTFGRWSPPVNLGPNVNSDGTEVGPALSADGLSLYFASPTRPGLGGMDMWVSQRPSLSGAWGPEGPSRCFREPTDRGGTHRLASRRVR
jgi:hypothetical protein